MNTIKAYSPSSKMTIHIPSCLMTANGTWICKDKSAGHENPADLSFDVELDEKKWIAIDGPNVVRFPIEKEWEWRSKRAVEFLQSIPNDPKQKVEHLECVASLVGINLPELVSILNKNRSSGENLIDTFKRLK